MPVPFGYTGETVPGATTLSVVITAEKTSAPGPWPFLAHASASSGSGISDPSTQVEYAWSGGRSQQFTEPVYGEAFDLSTDQRGHVFGNVIESSGQILCEGRVWTGSAFIADSDSISVTASARAGTALYFDSVSGNDSNPGTEAEPKQSASAIVTHLEGGGGRIAYLKYGSSWTGLGSNWLEIPAGTGGAMIAYGEPGDGKPELVASGGNSGGFLIDNASTRPTDFLIQNIVLDGNNTTDALQVSGTTNAHEGFLCDGCELRRPYTGSGQGGAMAGWNNLNFTRAMFIGCLVDRGTADKVAFYCESLGSLAFIFNTHEGGGSNSSHDHYCNRHSVFLFLGYSRTNQPAGGGGNILKLRAGRNDSPTNTENVLISECYFVNHSAMLSLGDAAEETGGTMSNAVIQRCAFNVNTNQTLGIFITNLANFHLRDNLMWAPVEAQYFFKLTEVCTGRIYRNRAYQTDNGGNNRYWQLQGHESGTSLTFYENTIYAGGATTIYHVNSNTPSWCTFGPGNVYYHPSISTIAYNVSGPENLTPAQWKTFSGSDADLGESNPSWVTPGSGIFDPKALGVQTLQGAELSHQETLALGTIPAGFELTLHLANLGRRQNLAVSSVGDSGNATIVESPTSLKDPHRVYPLRLTADSGSGTTITVSNDGPQASFEIPITWALEDAPAAPTRSVNIGGLGLVIQE